MEEFRLFLKVFSIVLGALFPFMILYVLKLLILATKEEIKIWEYRINERKETKSLRPPYDKIIFEKVPNKTMVQMVIFKGNKIIFKRGIDKYEIFKPII